MPPAGWYSPAVVKAVSFFKRRAGMAVDDFQAYWRGKHPEAVLRLPGIRRYVQSHTRPAGYARGEPIYDGIAELWWDSREVLTAAVATPAGLRAGEELLEDERRFIDLERSPRWIVVERPVV